MPDEFDYKWDLLKLEVETLQQAIRGYDTILFTIKGWAITLFSAAIFFTAQSNRPTYLLFCASAVFLFWIADAVFKITQRRFISRYDLIQKYLQGPDFAQALKIRSFEGLIIPDIFNSKGPRTSNRWKLLYLTMIHHGTSIVYLVMLSLVVMLSILMLT